MKKLKLEIEKLKVESFRVAPSTGERGTVHGAGSDLLFQCAGSTTVVANMCYPDSNVMDCIYMESRTCACPV